MNYSFAGNTAFYIGQWVDGEYIEYRWNPRSKSFTPWGKDLS